jgi:transposase InsO family protein
MPWKVNTMSDSRREFVELALRSGSNMSELCRRFGVSRKTAYKWLGRYKEAGVPGLNDQSRRPKCSPKRTSVILEEQVVELRSVHPAWGGRKLRRRLLDQGVKQVPAASTITEILRRRDLLSELKGGQAFQRFERERPNELWQMDFKGHFGLGAGGRCHPLTVLDDHSRYALVLEACGNEQGQTVEGRLRQAFRRYGLPEAMLMDNGSPWGDDRESPWTPLTVWLLRLGVRVIHGRPYHPQTQGKEERFHRTLVAEVLQGRVFRDLEECQFRFDEWRIIYNHERPHEALDLAVPGSRYEPSRRSFPEQVPELEFSPTDVIRKVQRAGWFSFQGQEWRISKAFWGERVGVRPTVQDGVWQVWFGRQCLGEIDQHAEAENRRVVRRPQVEQAAVPSGGGTDSVRCAHYVRSSPTQ